MIHSVTPTYVFEFVVTYFELGEAGHVADLRRHGSKVVVAGVQYGQFRVEEEGPARPRTDCV